MSTLQAIPTEYGIDILNSELKDTVTKYQLIGALTLDANSEDLSSFYSSMIETSYYDENGVLTFVMNLPIETHFNEYLYKINVLDDANQVVIECDTPKIALAKGIGGIVTLKAAVTGESGEVIFKNGDFVTESELLDVHLPKYPLTAISQFLPYSPNRVYTVGEVSYTKDANGKVSYWEWYSNVESLAGKDPLNTANRRIGWTDETKPYYWKPRSSKMPGETMAWDADTIPENMVVGMGQQLPVAVYHSLANARPDWIDATDNTLINIPDRQGRFVRAANGSDWLAGETHEDAIRNITGRITGGSSGDQMGTFVDGSPYVGGAFYVGGLGHPRVSVSYLTASGADRAASAFFDASLTVPTSSENQPRAYIEWVGYAL